MADRPQEGLYIVFTPNKHPRLGHRELMFWKQGRWSYAWSGQYYNGDVDGYLGPIPERLNSYQDFPNG